MPKYTRTIVGTYPDPEGSSGLGILVTGWTDDAWNARQDAIRRYNEDLAWRRRHPILSWARDAGGDILNGVGNFVNDEILLNKDNIRVRNAQAHPEVMDAIQEGGNIAGGLLLGGLVAPPIIGNAIATAPTWAPYALQGLKNLATPRGVLAADLVTMLGLTANQWLPWLVGGTTALATIPTVKYISEHGVPEISLPRSGARDFAKSLPPVDLTATGVDNPPVDLTATGVDNPPAPAPNPNQGDDKEPDDKEKSSKWYHKWWETSGNGSTSKIGPKVGRFVRNWGIRMPAYTAAGAPVVDVFGNIIGASLEPDSVPHQWLWKATNLRFMPEKTLFRGFGKVYMTSPVTPGDSILVQLQTAAPVDTVPAATTEQLPDSVVVNQNNDWEEWLKSRGTE